MSQTACLSEGSRFIILTTRVSELERPRLQAAVQIAVKPKHPSKGENEQFIVHPMSISLMYCTWLTWSLVFLKYVYCTVAYLLYIWDVPCYCGSIFYFFIKGPRLSLLEVKDALIRGGGKEADSQRRPLLVFVPKRPPYKDKPGSNSLNPTDHRCGLRRHQNMLFYIHVRQLKSLLHYIHLHNSLWRCL